jgi:hypothetical protein
MNLDDHRKQEKENAHIGGSHNSARPPPGIALRRSDDPRRIPPHLRTDAREYQRYLVLEYLVMCVKEEQLRWFDLQADRELKPDADGIYRMRTFPGLWINSQALFAQDYQSLMRTLEVGLATPEHNAFIQQLASQRRPAKKGRRKRE